MYKVTQQDYDVIVFLTKLVYLDLEFPDVFNHKERINKITGLRIDIFDMGDYDLFIICGTNGLNDWVANFKVGLGFTPRQYDQAYFYIKNNTPNTSKPIIISGHSLGGGIAEYVSSSLYYHQQVICFTFNGCGCSHLIHPLLRKENDVYNIITDNDILNGITLRIPFVQYYMQHTGKIIMMKDKKHILLSVGSHGNFSLFGKLDVQQLYE